MKAILTYHSIDGSGSVISVDSDTFRRHVEWLCTANVPVRPLSDLVDPECREGIALTFDDGFENFAAEAWPILRTYDLPATVFVVRDWVGRDNGWDSEDLRIPRLPLMSWSTLAELASEGVDLGGHSCAHSDLRQLDGDPLRVELEACRDAIVRETGAVPSAFAYPYGQYETGTVRAVADAGYTLAVTTEMALLDATPAAPLELPRLDAFYLRPPGTLERWGTESFRRFVWFRAGARRVRKLLTRIRLLT
jgi:peptidoglycan/xylan/chitin deacetylase (PgdA/CDA1 family)